MRSALVYRDVVLPPSETFIRAQAAAMTHYRPVIVGGQRLDPLDLRGLESEIVTGRGKSLLTRRISRRLGFFSEASVAALRELRPAVLHAHFGQDGLIAAPLARKLGLPFVVTFHGHDATREASTLRADPRTWLYQKEVGRLDTRASLLLAVSDHIRQRLLARGLSEDRIQTHYIGVDPQHFTVHRASQEPGLILAVGRFIEKKGFADLVSAFEIVAERDSSARLAILGDGPLHAGLRERAKHLGDRVTMPGSASRDEVLDWMHRSEVMVVPSVTAQDGDTEGLPTTLLEAMSCGLPTVATIHAGIPEAVVVGETGFLVPEREPEALAHSILSLLSDRAMATQLGDHARERILSRFNLHTQTAELEEIYRNLSRAGA